MSLSLNDLSSVVQIIDMVARRGAFTGEEMEPVGALRSKIVNLLKEAQQSQQVQEPQPPQDEVAPEE